jgi:hypothetical protein
VNRAELRQLAEDRVLDSAALLAAGRWSAAYYLAGYAVECGLKSCVLAYIEKTGIIFDDKKYGERCWTHDLETLVGLADLAAVRGAAVAANAIARQAWTVVDEWSEQSRYEQKTQLEAQELFDAVTDPTDGVLTWIRGHW